MIRLVFPYTRRPTEETGRNYYILSTKAIYPMADANIHLYIKPTQTLANTIHSIFRHRIPFVRKRLKYAVVSA